MATRINVIFKETSQNMTTKFGVSEQMFSTSFGQFYGVDGYEEGYSKGYADGCIDTDENFEILLKTI